MPVGSQSRKGETVERMRKPINFEEAMTRLQIIVEKLEKGEESLEESMKLFEEGAKLSADCYGILTKAKQKITEFSKIEKQTEEQDEE